MSEEQQHYPIPIGHCSYCGKAVFTSIHWYTVTTYLGAMRLCDLCGSKETTAIEGGMESWRGAITLPANYRRKSPNRKGKRRGSPNEW